MNAATFVLALSLALVCADGIACRQTPQGVEEAEKNRDPLVKKGMELQRQGKVSEAVKTYVRATKNGSYEAAKLIGDIYAEGAGDVPKDYGESLRWYQRADKMGDPGVPRCRQP